jgi:hypothetical protein
MHYNHRHTLTSAEKFCLFLKGAVGRSNFTQYLRDIFMPSVGAPYIFFVW